MKTTFTLVLSFAIQAITNAQTPDKAAYMIRMELSPVATPAESPLGESRIQLSQDHTADALRNEEQQLQDEISAAQKNLIRKKIAVSRIRSHITYNLFAANNILLKDLAANPSLKTAIVEKSEALNSQAAEDIRLAKEIREEADAQPAPEAQLAELSNAEEKETLALARQQEAIRILKAAAPLFIKQNSPELIAQHEVRITETKTTAEPNALAGLIQQAEALNHTCKQLRATAEGKTGHEKSVMLDEAMTMEQEYIAARIHISIRRYQQTEKTFQSNKQFITLLMDAIGDNALTQKAQTLSAEADYNFRLGKEIREEANAQPTEAARLAEVSNAEEKELLAINQQKQSVQELRKLNKTMLLASR